MNNQERQIHHLLRDYAHMGQYLKYLRRTQKRPLYVTFFATSRCNLRCRHCFYWSDLNKPEELSLDEIEKLAKSLKSPLHIAVTGGEPFLREDIGRIIGLFHAHSGARVISTVTNGYFTQAIIRAVREVMSQNPNLIWSIIVSIDGFEAVHDHIRGIKGSHKRAMDTVEQLQGLKTGFSNLNVGVITTLNRHNRSSIAELYDHLMDSPALDSLQINLLRGQPKNLTLEKADLTAYRKIIEEIKNDIYRGRHKGYSNFTGGGLYQAANIVFRDVVYRVGASRSYKLPCAAGRLNGVIYPSGEVFACEILPSALMGNLKDFDFNLTRLWNGKKADEVRDFIYRTRCFCTHECQLATSVMFHPVYLCRIGWEYAKTGALRAMRKLRA